MCTAHETYLSSNEHSKGRKAVLHPAEQSVRKWSRSIPGCVENARVNNHLEKICCSAHSLGNDPPGTAEACTHPFKICGWKMLWCLIHKCFWAWLHWKCVPWGTLLGDFLKDLLWAGEFWSELELEDINRNRLQKTKAAEIYFKDTWYWKACHFLFCFSHRKALPEPL